MSPFRTGPARLPCQPMVWLLVACGLAVAAAAPPFYPDKTRLLVYRDADGTGHPVTTAADWARRRAHILANMQDIMGPLPDASRTVAIGKGEPAGLGRRENLRCAVHLAERGYVTVAPDCPSLGEYAYDFAKSPFQSGTMKAICPRSGRSPTPGWIAG